jgi:hypothetical protein
MSKGCHESAQFLSAICWGILLRKKWSLSLCRQALCLSVAFSVDQLRCGVRDLVRYLAGDPSRPRFFNIALVFGGAPRHASYILARS